jgi:hypothetical protein
MHSRKFLLTTRVWPPIICTNRRPAPQQRGFRWNRTRSASHSRASGAGAGLICRSALSIIKSVPTSSTASAIDRLRPWNQLKAARFKHRRAPKRSAFCLIQMNYSLKTEVYPVPGHQISVVASARHNLRRSRVIRAIEAPDLQQCFG